MNELKDCIRIWDTWDVVDAIGQHMTVSERLHAFLLGNEKEHLQRIVALDIDSLCARLYLALHDREQYQKIVNLPKDQLQIVLDLLQTVR